MKLNKMIVATMALALPFIFNSCDKSQAEEKKSSTPKESVAQVVAEIPQEVIVAVAGDKGAKLFRLREGTVRLAIWSTLNKGVFSQDITHFSLTGEDVMGAKVAEEVYGIYIIMSPRGELVSSNDMVTAKAVQGEYKRAMFPPVVAAVAPPTPVVAPPAPAAPAPATPAPAEAAVPPVTSPVVVIPVVPAAPEAASKPTKLDSIKEKIGELTGH